MNSAGRAQSSVSMHYLHSQSTFYSKSENGVNEDDRRIQDIILLWAKILAHVHAHVHAAQTHDTDVGAQSLTLRECGRVYGYWIWKG